jgi:hypothetical protein
MYIGAWPQNIGNAFFDLGALAIIKKIAPNATIYRTGGSVHWMFNASAKKNESRVVRKLRKVTNNPIPRNPNSVEIGQVAELDLLVFAGMSMCEEFVLNNGKTFIEASKRGIPVLLLGTGGSLYNERDTRVFSDFVNSLCKTAVITRDDDTYNLFKTNLKNIHSGIDCAFFLPDYYTPPKLVLPDYNVECFDEFLDTTVTHTEGRLVVRAHHDMWGPLRNEYINKPMTLVSDIPEDYLTIYAQSKITYSDRVHACVATLAYGNEAQLYSQTPRKALFSKVGLPDITKKVCKLNKDMFAELKENQIHLAKKSLDFLLN